jgi:hypothetical protein
MLVAGIKFDDRNGNGLLDPTEPGIPGWTIEVLSGIGNVLGSAVTEADGSYTVRVTPEQLPVGLNTFGIREQQRTGWTATGPASGRYDGLPIQLGLGGARLRQLPGRDRPRREAMTRHRCATAAKRAVGLADRAHRFARHRAGGDRRRR